MKAPPPGRRGWPITLLLAGMLVVGAGAGCGERATPPTSGSATEADAQARVPDGQLPDTARPTAYRLHLRIDPDTEGFSGRTEIDVELAQPVDAIWLHGQDLQVSAVTVRTADGSETDAAYQQETDTGVARVRFEQVLSAGPVTLAFDYRAPFNDSLEGLYRITSGGRQYASTQFEATSARLAFPGFDEPRFKVPFDISLEVRNGHQSVTNTPMADEQPAADGFVLRRFARTPPLPTYLLAFIVGPWDHRIGEAIPASPLRAQPIPVRGFAAAGKGEQLGYALTHTSDIVTALESYFGTAYPYRKLDVIAVPDFAAGAMENAGAITYREQLLLFDETASLARRQAFASVHAHELAHQWFGNLVTPAWWDDIWLNEAFATWMAAKVMEQLQPGQGFAMRQLRDALWVMNEDAQISARQIRQPIEDHADIGDAFDGITYEKGGAVLTMLERFVGADHFKRGIQQYMAAHRFANADARDFVRAIAATRPDLPQGQVERAFFSFLEQPGIPLVELDWSCPDGQPVEITVRQSRYLPLGSEGDAARHWVLPMCVAFGTPEQRSEQCELIDAPEASFELSTSTCPAYLMPNADAAGYYRFSLDDRGWRALLEARNLTDAERLAASASLSGAFRAGRLGTGDYLELVRRLIASTDDVEVITAPFDDLEWIHDRLLTAANQQRLRTLLGDYYAQAAGRVPLERPPEGPGEERLQHQLAELYGLLIEAPAWRRRLTDRAVRYVQAQEDPAERPASALLPSHLQEPAFTVAVETLGDDFAARLLAIFRATDDAQLRQQILRSLSRGGSADLLARLRALVLTDAIRDNEVDFVLGPQLQEPDSREAAWAWLSENYDTVAGRLPAWFRGSLVEYGASFCSAGRAEQINQALAGRTIRMGGERNLAKTLEAIRLCEALVLHHEDSANSRLSQWQP